MFETGLSDFHKLLVTVLKSTFPKSSPKIITYKHPPIKKKYIRANHSNFLMKAIMLRSRFQNIFLKDKSLKSKKVYNKQCNICIKMVKKNTIKTNYYQKLLSTRNFGKL